MFRFDTPTARLRTVAFVEGLSYLALLFVAMPLKYMAEKEIGVKIAGPVHGLLFVWGGILANEAIQHRGKTWKWGWKVLGLALVPFGTFLLDRELKEDDEAYRRELAESEPAP